MRALSASDLLDIWERGAGREPVEKALAILIAAFPQAPEDVLARLDFVQRDLFLLHLRSLTFGSQIRGLADCPACKQRLELDFNSRELPAWTVPLTDPQSLQMPRPASSLRVDNYEITFRLPDSTDLLVISSIPDPASRRRHLLEACVTSATHQGQALAPDELPPRAMQLLGEQISQDHPLADLSLPVTCPTCSHTWEIIFDIVSYFWGEIQAWSLRLIHEVHTLAMAYGWRETEILEMSAWRRQHYLEMIGVR